MFVLLVNPLLYIFTHSLGVRKSVFYHVITIFTKNNKQHQSWGSHSSHPSEMSSLPSHSSIMLPQMWDKFWHPEVWQINMRLGCSQYRCPSQGRKGRESSLLVPGLKESALCIQDLFSSMARKVVERPGIAHLLPFSSSVRLKQNWFPFGWFSVSHSQ